MFYIVSCSSSSVIYYTTSSIVMLTYVVKASFILPGLVPYNLWKRFPHLVHVEETTLHRPNYFELEKIWRSETYNWRDNYSVHLWFRLWRQKNLYYQ